MSTLTGFARFPSHRSDAVKTSEKWLEAKVRDDALPDDHLWRVRESLYDFAEFVDKHPGGADWLTATRGTDITEAFECSHPHIVKAEGFLRRYLVRELKGAELERNSPYSFEPDGFYCTLRGRVAKILREGEGVSGSTGRMQAITDGLLVGWLVLMTSALFWDSAMLAVVAGAVLNLAVISAHNYFHQRDNWRMFVFDLGFLSSFEWRISHALSHHLFPNTVMDVEVSGLEPWLQFLPRRESKAGFARFVAPLYSPLIYCVALPAELIKRLVLQLSGRQRVRRENLLLPVEVVALTALAVFVCGLPVGRALSLQLTMHMVSSFLFVWMGLAAAHHHPDIWHDGDEPNVSPEQDFGACQLDAVRDRPEVQDNLFLTAVWFGDHALHHMFPTVDMSKLAALRPVLAETCAEFGLDVPLAPAAEMAVGQYKQLVRLETHGKRDKKAQ